MLLTPEQMGRAVEVMRGYLAAPKNPDGLSPREASHQRDRKRESLIDKELKPLLKEYLSGGVRLSDFKSKIDGINKRNELWGFKGIKGQMFFNMIVNVADSERECDQEIRAAITMPENDDVAASRINTFSSYVKRIGQQHVEAGGSQHGKPKPSSVPFFLSYFWQIQDRGTWPVFYTSSVNTMSDLNLWQPTGDLGADYITYKKSQEELAHAFSQTSGLTFDLYEVEHVFWFHGGNPFGGDKPVTKPRAMEEIEERLGEVAGEIGRLPESYVPPIVAMLPRMARNEPALQQAARASGTSLDRAFEKSINAAFTLLGYEAKLLGQGQGRVPDGLALDVDNSYAILWDAKVRTDAYSMGTDDRVIKEYIVSQSRELKRRKGLRNTYYLVISSHFADDYDDAIRSIKMETDVNEVCLVEADALVAMVDAKMRAPREVSLGPDGLQRLFAVSGVLVAENVRETLI